MGTSRSIGRTMFEHGSTNLHAKHADALVNAEKLSTSVQLILSFVVAVVKYIYIYFLILHLAARQKKAVKIFPRPTAGPLCPIVQCQTLKYNMKS
jgi:Ribosomal protein L13e